MMPKRTVSQIRPYMGQIYFFLNFKFLGAKKRLYKRLRQLVGWLVGWSVPILLRKLVTSRLLREEEEEEENWLHCYSFAPRD
jgi:hypothetical protein